MSLEVKSSISGRKPFSYPRMHEALGGLYLNDARKSCYDICFDFF